MKIFSIIVTYNGMQHNWIQTCLDSLLASSVKTEIIVIDNGSIDGTIDLIQKKYPQVDVMLANANLGFAKANNIGIKKAYEQGADFIFLLNQDAWVEEKTIERLVEAFQQLPEAGIVSPVHLNGSKTHLDYGFVNYITPPNTPDFISDLYFNRLQDFYETSFVNAAAWLIRRECIEKVGGFDTLLFYHYGEDYNYCQRVIYHGSKLYIATTTTICHDREERKGNWSVEHEKRQGEVWECSCYADIRQDDTLLHGLKVRLSLQYAVKKILKLQFKNFFVQRERDKRLYINIKQSREQNKKRGLNWL